MLIDELIFSSDELAKKIEFVTLQSSERRDEEIRYKNINRKLIIFDLQDIETMLMLGSLLTPYGIKENLENKMLDSSIGSFRLWAEKKIADRAVRLMRSLYHKHPEKFTQVQYEKSRSKNMKLLSCQYILSEMTTNKSISLKDDRTDQASDMQELANRAAKEESLLQHQKDVMEGLTHEDRADEKQNLISHAN